MDPNNQPQPAPVPQPAPAAQSALAYSPPTPLAPSSPGADVTPEDALKSVHTSGTWSIVAGLIYLLVSAPGLVWLNSFKTGANKASVAGVVVVGIVGGIILGVPLIVMGMKLRKIQPSEMLTKGYKLIRILTFIWAGIILISLLSGGGGVGLLNLVLLIFITRANSKILKLKKAAARPVTVS